MVPRKQVRIEFGSPEMFRAWVDGLEAYDVTLRGRKIEQEGGVTEVSSGTIRKIMTLTGRQPDSIVVGPNNGCLFTFGELGSYLATGYRPGWGGVGGMGIVEIAEECGFGTRQECLAVAIEWGHGQQGAMYSKAAEYGEVYAHEPASPSGHLASSAT